MDQKGPYVCTMDQDQNNRAVTLPDVISVPTNRRHGVRYMVGSFTPNSLYMMAEGINEEWIANTNNNSSGIRDSCSSSNKSDNSGNDSNRDNNNNHENDNNDNNDNYSSNNNRDKSDNKKKANNSYNGSNNNRNGNRRITRNRNNHTTWPSKDSNNPNNHFGPTKSFRRLVRMNATSIRENIATRELKYLMSVDEPDATIETPPSVNKKRRFNPTWTTELEVNQQLDREESSDHRRGEATNFSFYACATGMHQDIPANGFKDLLPRDSLNDDMEEEEVQEDTELFRRSDRTESFHAHTVDNDNNIGKESPSSTLSTIDVEETMSAKQLQSLVTKRTDEKRAELVQKFVSALTLHGFAQFHEAAGLRKLLWAVILAAMAVFIVRLTYLSYRSENYYKQVIEFETKKVKKIDFPTVTICNFSPVYGVEMYERFPINISEEEFYFNVLSNRRNHEKVSNSPLHNRILNQLKRKGYSSYKDLLQLFEKHEEQDINSMVIRKIMRQYRCRYENRECDFSSYFTEVYRHSSQSLCKQFNFYEKGKEGEKLTGNDIYNGLFMFWDISGRNYYYDYGLNGLLMEIHPYGTPHQLIDHRNTIYLEPGACTNIDIEEVVTKRLPPPFKPNCGERELKVIKDYPYSKAICEVDCFLSRILDKCGCVVDQFAQYVHNERVCNITEMVCTYGLFDTVDAVTHDSHCHECPVKCEATEYKVSTSRLGIGNNLVFKTLQAEPQWKNKTQGEIEAYINLNIVGFRIGFKSLEKQIRRYKEAVPWYERISMLGGIMGLLLGFSVITGFELLFFLFDYLYVTIKYRCTQEYLSTILQQEKLKTALKERASRFSRSGQKYSRAETS